MVSRGSVGVYQSGMAESELANRGKRGEDNNLLVRMITHSFLWLGCHAHKFSDRRVKSGGSPVGARAEPGVKRPARGFTFVV